MELRGREGILEEREPHRYSVRIAPRHGDITPEALLKLTEVVSEFTTSGAKIGFEQELWLTRVSGHLVERLFTQLDGQELGTPVERRQLIVACSGATTCQLGILRSRDAADAIEQHLKQQGATLRGEPIRISGCPNACSRHLVAQLGFEGRVKRVGSHRLPSYAVYWGGSRGPKAARLGANLGVIPAKRLPEFVCAVSRIEPGPNESTAERQQLLTALVEEFSTLPESIPSDWFLDFGSDSALDLSEIGEGECATTI